MASIIEGTVGLYSSLTLQVLLARLVMRGICFSAHVKKGVNLIYFFLLLSLSFRPGGKTVPTRTRINVPVPPFLKGAMFICLTMLKVIFANIWAFVGEKSIGISLVFFINIRNVVCVLLYRHAAALYYFCFLANRITR